jgi:hypothetical protein
MNPKLEATIGDAYRIFAHYEVRHSLTVCHCPSCMTVEVEHELLKTPLRQISSSLLSGYTNSAHNWNDGPVAREVRYFLPRYLELIAANDPPDNLGLDICLRRLGQTQWREKWPPAEVDVLDRFFDHFALACLQRLDLEQTPSGWWQLAFDFKAVLTLAITAGGDLNRILAAWNAAEDPAAATHGASLRYDLADDGRGPYLCSPCLERDHTEAAYRIGAFLMGQDITERIEAACFLTTDDNMQKFLSDVLYIKLHSHPISFCRLYCS